MWWESYVGAEEAGLVDVGNWMVVPRSWAGERRMRKQA